MGLEEPFIQKCREAFAMFDLENSGAIDRAQLKQFLKAIGENPTDEEFFRIMAEIEEDSSGRIEFAEFLRAFENQRSATALEDQRDTILAWVALGGKEDRSGLLDTDKLVKIVKEDFDLTIDIQTLVRELDINKDGQIDYKEFSTLFR